MILKLSDMAPGTKGIIRSFENENLHLKLMEMGCIPGEFVTMGNNQSDPIRINISGYQLSLRLDEAQSVVVEVLT